MSKKSGKEDTDLIIIEMKDTEIKGLIENIKIEIKEGMVDMIGIKRDNGIEIDETIGKIMNNIIKTKTNKNNAKDLGRKILKETIKILIILA